MITRVEYEAFICQRLEQAEFVPFRPVAPLEWSPRVASCHENVDRWVAANPGAAAVRGWVTYASFGDATGLTAHSVVRGADGLLFDITPLENEYYRPGMRFIPHLGDEQVFFAMKAINLCMCCPIEAANLDGLN